MRASAVAISAGACALVVALAAWVFELSLERAALLAPVIVVTVGVTVALGVLWTRIALESLRAQRHPGRIVATGVAVLTALVVLSFFVELPAGH